MFPILFKATTNQPVFRLDRLILPLSAFCLVARTLDFQTPLRQRGVVIGFQLFDREGCSRERRRCERFQKSMTDRLVDSDTPDVEAMEERAKALDWLHPCSNIADWRSCAST